MQDARIESYGCCMRLIRKIRLFFGCPLPPFGRPLAHAGFYTAYSTVQEEVLTALDEVVRSVRPDLPVYVTGHSMGAAIASFAAYDISRRYAARHVVMYNFGCPRLGNEVFKRIFEEQVIPPEDSHLILKRK